MFYIQFLPNQEQNCYNPAFSCFLLQAPHWGSDLPPAPPWATPSYFNPRSPRGERLQAATAHKTYHEFQSTLPMGGERLDQRATVGWKALFQSTLPVGGATLSVELTVPLKEISIHAPRGGSDWQPGKTGTCSSDFNPRSPWGERPGVFDRGYPAGYFNPRSPWGERPRPIKPIMPVEKFQSTLPVGGATSGLPCCLKPLGFQSTLPVGGATSFFVHMIHRILISIHAPRGGSDGRYRRADSPRAGISIHAPRGGSDSKCCR